MENAAWRNKIRKARHEYVSDFIEIIWEADGITQTELLQKLKMSTPTMLQYLKMFRDKGLLDESQYARSGGGRRPKLIRFAADSHFSIGIRLQRAKYSIVLINMRGEVKYSHVLQTEFQNTAAYWQKMNEACCAMCEELAVPDEKILGIGLAFPGVLRVDLNEIMYSAEIHELDGIKFEEIEQYFTFPMIFENEAAAAGYAEAWERHRGNDVAYLMVEDGIQGALITKDGIERGNRGLLGVFGHMVIHTGGPKCVCGRCGCLEVYCSTQVLKKMAGGSLKKFRSLLDKGEKQAKEAFREYVENLRTGTENLRLILDADVVVGGELTETLGEYLKDYGLLAQGERSETYVSYLSLACWGSIASAVGVALQHNVAFFNSGF